MSSRLLQRCGEALYGPRWQSDIARDLHVTDRTVRRWLDGSNDVPDGVYLDLQRLLTERAAEIDDLIDALTKSTPPK